MIVLYFFTNTNGDWRDFFIRSKMIDYVHYILKLNAFWIVHSFILERKLHEKDQWLWYFACICILILFVAAVHCERFSGGEHGEDPEAEAGSGGEGFWLLKHRKENVSHWWHQSSDGAVDVFTWEQHKHWKGWLCSFVGSESWHLKGCRDCFIIFDIWFWFWYRFTNIVLNSVLC